MVDLGKVHSTYGVQLSQLQSFGDVLTDCVRRHTPLKWTEEHTNAWQWFWKIVVDLFSRGMLEHIEEKKELEELIQERGAQKLIATEDDGNNTNIDADADVDTSVDETQNEESAFKLRRRFINNKLEDDVMSIKKNKEE
ncbi:hypothetical protein RFI_31955 [Reticulomyxa filosa]|uniref:Globin family profile domain-containing protein n=1 Tax=Reticulomyxa filosa TaxID=46433 RepID=X6LXK5_RETFI|nr:hypothetical protein RFI_31955 [Reticulomyxa filosa]|eukprot:ETO05440.1 hypothetical protein RFI_31955 [Reticulomyxa filosa]